MDDLGFIYFPDMKPDSEEICIILKCITKKRSVYWFSKNCFGGKFSMEKWSDWFKQWKMEKL